MDENLKVYLVDFGLARIGGEMMALSTIVAGTPGFMPPEQLLNKSLTDASDLYGVGATLICVITGITSVELSNLVDSKFQINFHPLVTRYSLRFIKWLEQLTKPDYTERYPNAKTALKELEPLDIIRVPEVNLEPSELLFNATIVGEKVTQRIKITNKISDTILQGEWCVAPHPSDPPYTPEHHEWISFDSKQFKSNQLDCVVKVDMGKLRADQEYNRNIILTSNARQKQYHVKVKVKTAPLPLMKVPMPPYGVLAIIGVFGAILSTVRILFDEAKIIDILNTSHITTIGSIDPQLLRWIGGGIRWALDLGIVGAIMSGMTKKSDDRSLFLLIGMFMGGMIGGIVVGIFGAGGGIFGAFAWIASNEKGISWEIIEMVIWSIFKGISWGMIGAIYGVIYGAILGAMYGVIFGIIYRVVEWAKDIMRRREFEKHIDSLYVGITF